MLKMLKKDNVLDNLRISFGDIYQVIDVIAFHNIVIIMNRRPNLNLRQNSMQPTTKKVLKTTHFNNQ